MTALSAPRRFLRLVRGLAWPPDKWQRLSVVADFAAPASSILDVGGRGREMRRLVATPIVVSANVEQPCDVQIERGRLPFEDKTFDVVTCTDVLEHIAASDRPPFITELTRVARRRVVICFPNGSPEKDSAEQRLADQLKRDYNTTFDFLNEHLEHGLPRPAEVEFVIREAAPEAQVLTYFQNGIEDSDRVLVDAVRVVRRGDIGALFRVAHAWVRRKPPRLTTVLHPTNNRAYVVADLAG